MKTKKRKSQPTTPHTVRMSTKVWDAFERIATKQSRSRNNLAAKVLTDYVEREGKEPTQ